MNASVLMAAASTAGTPVPTSGGGSLPSSTSQTQQYNFTSSYQEEINATLLQTNSSTPPQPTFGYISLNSTSFTSEQVSDFNQTSNVVLATESPISYEFTNFTSELGSGIEGSGWEDGNSTSIFQDENLLPVKVLSFINDSLEESGSGSGSGYLELNFWDLFPGENMSDFTTQSPGGLTLLYYSLGEMIIVSILLGILTLWTIFGNFLVLLSLWKFKPLRSMSNLLIGNLAVCDLLLALTVLPMSVVNDVLGHWVFGEVLCNLWLSTDVLYCTASIWSLCVIAMDRFTATQFPVWYRNKRSLRRAVTYMVIVWVFSVVVTVPPLFGWQDQSKNYQYSNQTGTYMCILFQNMEYVIYSASGSFIIPLFVQLTLYTKIFMILRERSKKISRAHKRTQPKPKPERVSIRMPPREIELSQVSRNDDSKYLFCEESSPDFEMKSDIEDEDVSVAIIDAERCLYQKRPSCDVTHGLLDKTHRNGVSATDATDSDTLVIHNPTSRCLTETCTDKESQSDQEKMTLMRKAPADLDPHPNGGSHKQKTFSVAIKTANPFKRDKASRTSLRKFDKREQRATQIMGIVITCFAVCWLPFLFMYLIRSLCASCPELNPNAQAFLIWLGYANSGLNPILYTIFNDDFRQAFYKLICCCFNKPKNNPQQL